MKKAQWKKFSFIEKDGNNWVIEKDGNNRVRIILNVSNSKWEIYYHCKSISLVIVFIIIFILKILNNQIFFQIKNSKTKK